MGVWRPWGMGQIAAILVVVCGCASPPKPRAEDTRRTSGPVRTPQGRMIQAIGAAPDDPDRNWQHAFAVADAKAALGREVKSYIRQWLNNFFCGAVPQGWPPCYHAILSSIPADPPPNPHEVDSWPEPGTGKFHVLVAVPVKDAFVEYRPLMLDTIRKKAPEVLGSKAGAAIKEFEAYIDKEIIRLSQPDEYR